MTSGNFSDRASHIGIATPFAVWNQIVLSSDSHVSRAFHLVPQLSSHQPYHVGYPYFLILLRYICPFLMFFLFMVSGALTRMVSSVLNEPQAFLTFFTRFVNVLRATFFSP